MFVLLGDWGGEGLVNALLNQSIFRFFDFLCKNSCTSLRPPCSALPPKFQSVFFFFFLSLNICTAWDFFVRPGWQPIVVDYIVLHIREELLCDWCIRGILLGLMILYSQQIAMWLAKEHTVISAEILQKLFPFRIVGQTTDVLLFDSGPGFLRTISWGLMLPHQVYIFFLSHFLKWFPFYVTNLSLVELLQQDWLFCHCSV